MAAEKEFAPGIPASRAVQPLPRLKEPEKWEFGVHRHLAERAGEHFDLRLGDPSAGHAHSWAMRRLPGPGEGVLAVQQPTHTLPYMDFKGSIVKGYGKGEVQLARRDKAEVLSADKNKLRFNVYPGKEVEEYLLVRGKGEGNQWYLRNVSLSRKSGPGQLLPSSKPKYKVVKEEKLGINDPRTELHAKIDGAHVFYHFKSPGTTPRTTSYRPTERATGLIDHTQKLEGFHNLRTPGSLGDTILRGELYAVDKKGKALPAARVGGLLNANVWKSRERQKQEGKLVPVAFDVVRWKGENVENYPFRDKKLMLQEAMKKAPWLGQPRSARTPEEKLKLISDIKKGKEPSTEEGVVEWKDSQSTPSKTKFLQERDVYLRNVVQERGKHNRPMAGTFEFSYTKNGPIIGRVGGGMSHALKKDMLEKPGLYKGLKVRIESQRAPAHYAPRSAQFISFHLDQELPEGIKTAADKKDYRRTRGVLLHKGIPIVRSLPKNPEKARDKLRSAIKRSEDPWSHPQVAVKKLDLDRLGFVPTRQAVPLPGEKPLSTTWRSGDLHAHKMKGYYLVHKDAVAPSGGVVSLMRHGVKDMPIALWTRFVRKPAPPILTKTAAAEARVVPHKEGKGYVIEKLYVPEGERGKGAARAKLQEIKKQYKGEPLWIRPRPFGDMPVDLGKLKGFYESEGFRVVDKKDNMLLKASQPNGEYRGAPSSPDSVKKIVPFMGLEIRVERPKGFIQRGFDAKGQYWERKYQLDYGHIKGTKGGDGDGLDVFLGPDKKADEAYWAIKLKDDGSFDEYKVFLGFPNREGAISAFKQHIPQRMLKGMVTMKVNMMKAMLGIEPLEKLGMVASFMDELEKMGKKEVLGTWEQRAPWYTTALGSTLGAGISQKVVPKKYKLLGMAGGAVLGTGIGLHGGEAIGRHIDKKSREGTS